MSSSSHSSPAAGGAGRRTAGRKLGRAALRADNKNSECCEEYVSRLTEAPTNKTIEAMAAECTIIGRVTKAVGCGSLQVLLQTGETVAIPISGNLRFKGKAATKGDRAVCMMAGDVIIVDGGFAAGKLTQSQLRQVRKAFATARFIVPGGFFVGQGEVTEDDWEETGFEFDHTGLATICPSDEEVDLDRI
jgi:hypothetical protein